MCVRVEINWECFFVTSTNKTLKPENAASMGFARLILMLELSCFHDVRRNIMWEKWNTITEQPNEIFTECWLFLKENKANDEAVRYLCSEAK